ncbi:MAG: hypothetical protein IT318_03250 [Anaerolineales bacterium]|nr:hypothetical protein [Anaerolineales bacterium]
MLITCSDLLPEFARYSLPLFAGLSIDGQPGARLVGGLEVARSPERWQELQRRA